MTEADVDGLAWKFLKSDYASKIYISWPLDRRLEGFLRHCGLARVADDGDGYNRLLDRVMRYISAASLQN